MSSTALPHLSPAQRQVAGVLAEVHDATILEITASAGVSKSTAAKALALLESTGAASRTIHTDGDIRLADNWSPTALTGQLLMAAATADGSGYGHAEALRRSGDAALVSPRCDAPMSEPTAQCGSVAEVETGDDGVGPDAVDRKASDDRTGLPECAQSELAASVTDSYSACPDENVPGGDETATPRKRLAPGGLAELVTAALTAHPDIDYTPTMLSHVLGDRSAGAIHNVLEKMHAAGTAVRVCDKPKRYRHSGA